MKHGLGGREVALLPEGWRGSGTHTARWDAHDLPAGLYFCRLSAGREVQSRKMLMVRRPVPKSRPRSLSHLVQLMLVFESGLK